MPVAEQYILLCLQLNNIPCYACSWLCRRIVPVAEQYLVLCSWKYPVQQFLKNIDNTIQKAWDSDTVLPADLSQMVGIEDLQGVKLICPRDPPYPYINAQKYFCWMYVDVKVGCWLRYQWLERDISILCVHNRHTWNEGNLKTHYRIIPHLLSKHLIKISPKITSHVLSWQRH